MVLMAGSFDADARLVAFMQYLRIVTVVVGATLVHPLLARPAPRHRAGGRVVSAGATEGAAGPLAPAARWPHRGADPAGSYC
jgi:uncharacterized membrane protein AbrB (regulator of aidB expression)